MHSSQHADFETARIVGYTSALTDSYLTVASRLILRSLIKSQIADEILDEMERNANSHRCDNKPILSRSERAQIAHNPAGEWKQGIAEGTEIEVSEALSGRHTKNTAEFDVILGDNNVGIEVKTLIDRKTNKVDMSKPALQRKRKWVRDHKAKMVTIVVDKRDEYAPDLYSGHTLYAREGAGSYHLNTFYTFDNFQELREWIDTL